MPLISDAIAQIRMPGVVDDEAKLREILNAVFKAGRLQFSRDERYKDEDPHHGMIMFNDGTVVTI